MARSSTVEPKLQNRQQKKIVLDVSKVGISAFKQLIEITSLIENDKKVKNKLSNIIEETQQHWNIEKRTKTTTNSPSRPETSKN